MDPNLFHVDYERLGEALAVVVALSFIVERALAPLFEQRTFVARYGDSGIKEPIAFLVALYICRHWDVDVLSTIVLTDHTQFVGHILTAATIAGGSKGSVTLFRDVLGVQSTAEKQRQAAAKKPRPVPQGNAAPGVEPAV